MEKTIQSSSCFSLGKTILHIVLSVVIFFAGDFIGSTLCDIVLSILRPAEWICMTVRAIVYTSVTWLLFYLYANKLLHMKMSDFRIKTPAFKAGDFLVALGLPALVYLAFCIIGTVSWNTALPSSTIRNILILELVAAIRAGVREELVFRGFIMTLFEKKWGKAASVIIPSFIFSLFHLGAMESYDVLSIVLMILGVTIVGMLLSLVTYWRCNIYASMLIHIVWNFLVGMTISVGAQTSEDALMSIVVPDTPLLTGGGFGIEASVIAIVAYAIFCWIVWRKQRSHDLVDSKHNESNTKPIT